MKRFDMDTTEQVGCDLIAAGSHRIYIPTVTAVLKEKVNFPALTYAAREAMAFHPYFATRLRREGETFYWEENNREPVILEQRIEEGLVYGDENNHFFPWSITYFENHLSFCASHELTDGGGVLVFLATLLEYYARYLRGDQSKIQEKTTREERLAGEAALPTEVGYRKGVQALYKPKRARPSLFRPETMGTKSNRKRISLAVQGLRKVSFGFDASPFALVALVLARACVPYLAGENKIVELLVPQDIRKYFGSQSLHNFVTAHHFHYYDEKMRKMSVELCATIFRGRLDLLSDRSNLEARFSALYEAGQMIHIPQVREQLRIAFEGKAFTGTNIIYTHLTQFAVSPLVREHLSNVYFESTSDPAAISCCALNFRDRVNLALGTYFLEDGFFTDICQQFQALGVDCNLEEVETEGKKYFVFSDEVKINHVEITGEYR